MANLADYEIHVRGKKEEAYMLYAATPCADFKQILRADWIDDDFIIHFNGNCKWGLDYNATDDYNGTIDSGRIDVQNLDEAGQGYWNISLKKKSELLHCEIEAYELMDDTDMYEESFVHLKNGVVIESKQASCDKIEWDPEEYPEYEEFCEDFDIDPEEISESDFEMDEWGCMVYLIGEPLDYSFTF